jgi:signal transduction histidine kinase
MQQPLSLSMDGDSPGLVTATYSSTPGQLPSRFPVNAYPTMPHREEPAAIAIETLSVFEEATQTAARFLTMPISAIGLREGEDLVLKAAVGLSHLGFMNPLARTRRLPLADSLVQTAWHQSQYLVLEDAATHELAQTSELLQGYGIQALIGLPLRTSMGQTIGLLMVMHTQPQAVTEQAIAFMEMVARWSVSEYERHQLTHAAAFSPAVPAPASKEKAADVALVDQVRLHLITQLTQELRPPLTSITGMAGMLGREIYGPLTPKQQEYTEIVRSSSQDLLNTVDEIIELGHLTPDAAALAPTTLDVEMVAQQVVSGLTNLAKQKEQELALTVEPRSRLWVLDKQVLKQLLYHLVFCVLHVSGEGGTIRIHASRRGDGLSLAVWLSNPWLGEGLPNSVVAFQPYLSSPSSGGHGDARALPLQAPPLSPAGQTAELERSREVLALILSRHLAESYGGHLALQGNPEAGYRFVALLPAQPAQPVE